MLTQTVLRLRDQAGALVDIIDHWTSLAYSSRVNAEGSFEVQINEQMCDSALFELDGQLEIWRKPYGGSWYKEFVGFHRVWDYATLKEGVEQFSSSGPGINNLLFRRILQGFAETAYTTKTGFAESVFKEFISEQAITGLISRVIPGLSNAASHAYGTTISVARAWKNLGDVLTEFAPISGGDFAVTQGATPGTFVFEFYPDQLGADRSIGNTDGNAPVIFSTAFGNMVTPARSYSRLAEVTSVIVGGKGLDVSREEVTRKNAAAIADSPWNEIEVFRSGINVEEGDTAGLNAVGDSVLQEAVAENVFTFDVAQTWGVRYGRDYFLGDMVSIQFEDAQFTKKILAAHISSNRDGEKITIEVGDMKGLVFSSPYVFSRPGPIMRQGRFNR